MTLKLDHYATYPLKIIQGSYPVRQRKIEQLCRKFYKELEPQFKHDVIELSQIENTIKKILPQRTDLKIKSTDMNDESFMAFYSSEYCILSNKKHFIIFNNNYQNGIKLKDLPLIIHEFRHFLDALYHPKFNKRDALCEILNSEYNLGFDDIFDKYLYTEKKYKGKLLIFNFLRKLAKSTRINFLQNIRYLIMTEDNAYRTEFNIAKKMYKHDIEFDETYNNNIPVALEFSELRKFIEKLLYKTIKKERKKNLKRIKK